MLVFIEMDRHTDTASHRRDSRRQCPLLLKVLRYDDNARQKEQPISNAYNDPLRNQQFSVAVADTSHHHA